MGDLISRIPPLPPSGFTGEVTLDTPSTVVSMNPTSPNNDAAAAPGGVSAPSRGLGYAPLQNELSTEPNAPVVMSPVDFDSPGPSPAHAAAGIGVRGGGGLPPYPPPPYFNYRPIY